MPERTVTEGVDNVWVTAYTDASFVRDRGGWSVWLRSERGRIVRSGECPGHICDSMCAELWAVIQAVEISISEWKDSVKGIQLNMDCISLCDRFWPWSRSFARHDLEALRMQVVETIKKADIRVRTKHVKGHSNGDGIRTYLNQQVDRMSRRKAKSGAR